MKTLEIKTLIVLVAMLTSCSWLSANPHTDILMIPPKTTIEE